MVDRVGCGQRVRKIALALQSVISQGVCDTFRSQNLVIVVPFKVFCSKSLRHEIIFLTIRNPINFVTRSSHGTVCARSAMRSGLVYSLPEIIISINNLPFVQYRSH